MAQVLGRITKAVASERGPDALYELHLPGEWLEHGASIEFELPRQLTCAACEGGGCDACGRSGAVTVRSKDAPPELVPVTLPRHTLTAGAPGVMLRIPECGGLAPEPSNLPRGLLLVRVLPGQTSTALLRRRDSVASLGSHVRRAPGLRPTVRHLQWTLLLLIGLVLAWWLGGR